MSEGEVRIEAAGPVGTLIISNPRKYNAMSMAMWHAFTAGIRTLDEDPAVKVIVVRGEGEAAFVSGADISQFEGKRTAVADQAAYDRVAEDAYLAPGRATKPVIAAIKGICMGGGLGLAAACDLRICSTDARFRMPAARLGLGYGVDGVRRFVALLGPQAVLDIFMTARVFDGNDALRLGFVSAVEAPERVDEKVGVIASAMAANAPLTLRAVKLSVRAATSRSDDAISVAMTAVAACASSSDYLEGKQAFLEKRAPVFQGS